MRRLSPVLAVLPLLLASCRDATIATYSVPKEVRAPATDSAPAPHSFDAPAASASANAQDLAWTAPASWQPKPGGSVRKGSYVIGDVDGPTADLSITAFPGDVGGDLANVNRWRSQLGLPPIEAAGLPSALTHVDVAGLHIDFVDLAHNDTRMLAAIVPHDGATWFIKLTGPDALVAAERPAYIAFLNTLRPGP